MGNYTELIKSELFEGKWGIYDTSEDEYSEIIEYLNSSGFRTFGEGLTAIISQRVNEGETILECLKRCFKEKDIDIKELGSPNTPKNWLGGGERPKKGEDSRRKMFVLAFALGLTINETAYLLQRVFLDRAFNPRNYKELIYYYCIENNLSLAKADEMISSVHFSSEIAADKTEYTRVLASVVNQSKSDLEIIDYINSHPHNFSINSVTAKEKVENYLIRAKNAVWGEINVEYPQYIEYPQYKKISYSEYIAGEVNRENLIISDVYSDTIKGKDITSVNFMYEMIFGQLITTNAGTEKSLFKNAYLPKEISVSFPTPQIFSKLHKDPTYDELRKILILLFSYCFWYNIQKNNDYADIEDYSAQLNDLLTECGLPTLYPGNPFDWLFCFCTMTDSPLDTFRAVIAEVLEKEE